MQWEGTCYTISFYLQETSAKSLCTLNINIMKVPLKFKQQKMLLRGLFRNSRQNIFIFGDFTMPSFIKS